MMHPKLRKLSHTIKDIVLRNSVASRLRRRVIVYFCEKVGFVYFGSVDQHHDDHHVVRGLTVSSSHKDYNYSVGSFDSYDVSLVDRFDALQTTNGRWKTHSWLIFEIDLHHGADLPHIFMGAHSQAHSAYARLFTAFPALQSVPLGTFEPHSDEFTRRYHLYAAPAHFLEVERQFSADMTRTIAAHFWPLSVEIRGGSLYIYADNQTLTVHLLETMLKNGLWLARRLDSIDTLK